MTDGFHSQMASDEESGSLSPWRHHVFVILPYAKGILQSFACWSIVLPVDLETIISTIVRNSLTKNGN